MPNEEIYLTQIGRFHASADAALIIYDVSRPETLEQAKIWAQELKNQVKRIIICGNKIDLLSASTDHIQITEAKNYAKTHNFSSLEVSGALN